MGPAFWSRCLWYSWRRVQVHCTPSTACESCEQKLAGIAGGIERI